MLSISTTFQRLDLNEQVQIFDAVSTGDEVVFSVFIIKKFSRIPELIKDMKSKKHTW